MDIDSRIYIAGHKGLVGSAIKRKLESLGYSNLSYESPEELDLRRQSDVEEFFCKERPEYIFLAAAKVGGILANKTYPAEFIYSNLMIQTNMIHCAFKYNVKKLMFLGSSCIYPKVSKQPIKEEYLLTDLLEPTNEAYAIAKISGLKMCKYYNQQFGTNFLSVMPTNLFGPNDNYNLETSHVMPAMIRKFLLAKYVENSDYDLIRKDLFHWGEAEDLSELNSKNKVQSLLKKFGIECLNGDRARINFWGSGKPKREFLYVDDLAELCVRIMQNYDANEIGDYVNVGCGIDISIKELALIIKNKIGFEGDLGWDSSKPDGTPRKLLNIDKVYKLGWRPSFSLDDGIEKTISNYIGSLEHPGLTH